MTKQLRIIKCDVGDTRYCDYCGEKEKTYVNDGDDRDICFDCVLEIYNFAKKEIL
jgi:hypothetical protein